MSAIVILLALSGAILLFALIAKDPDQLDRYGHSVRKRR